MLKAKESQLWKAESTYNTDPTPTESADAVEVFDVAPSWPVDVVKRPLVSVNMSPVAPVHGKKMFRLGFKVEIKGSGAAGTAPDVGVLLKACGFGETVVGGASVTYKPVSTGWSSVTGYRYIDGKRYKMTGARGNVKLILEAGKPGIFEFEITGHAVDPTDTALPAPTVDATIPVALKSGAFAINGYAAIVSKMEIDMKNEVTMPPSVNAPDGYGECRIVTREPQLTLDPEDVLIGTHDFWTEWKNSTQMAFTVALTGSAGNICTITAPKATFMEYSEDVREGNVIVPLTAMLARNAGNDEISIAFT